MEYEELSGLISLLNQHNEHKEPIYQWLGWPVYIDPSVPYGVVELRNVYGHVLAVFPPLDDTPKDEA